MDSSVAFYTYLKTSSFRFPAKTTVKRGRVTGPNQQALRSPGGPVSCSRRWLARQDSNLEPPDPESGAIPLGHAPARLLRAIQSLPRGHATRRHAAALGLDLRPGVLERQRPVEDRVLRRRVGVGGRSSRGARTGRSRRRPRARSDGSTSAPASTVSEPGSGRRTGRRPSAPGNGSAKRWSYRRTSAGTACAADTQWSVAFGRRPSGASPPRVAGS